MPRWEHPENGLVFCGMLLWSLSCFALGQVSGMLAAHLRMTPQVEALEAQLEEREETAAHLWTLYESAHCNLREAELHLQQWAWRDFAFWPEGDTSGIHCPWEATGSPLFAAAEGAVPEGGGTQPAPPERTAEAGRRGAQALVAAGPDAGR